jgi:hypothetical protein
MSQTFVATFEKHIMKDEVYFEADPKDSKSSLSIRGNVERIIRKSGYTTPRKNPKMLLVNVYSLCAKDGKRILTRSHHSNFEIYPPLARMTEDEFNEEQEKLLKDIPKEFHGAFPGVAWDNGHSAGLEEVISVLSDLISNFKQPIEDYGKRLVEECKNRIIAVKL